MALTLIGMIDFPSTRRRSKATEVWAGSTPSYIRKPRCPGARKSENAVMCCGSGSVTLEIQIGSGPRS
jgi:hypothetical protein